MVLTLALEVLLLNLTTDERVLINDLDIIVTIVIESEMILLMLPLKERMTQYLLHLNPLSNLMTNKSP